ncbi:MAG: alpha-L-fucosidase [Proteobacteria bacterium]|nr:alpha-L-fucosidase [Pseudomonadota bacterium]
MEKGYQPSLESVREHRVPEWYHDAKFGIFIHWSLSSVPAFAPTDKGDITEIVTKYGWKRHYANNPYAEWYQNSLRIENSPVSRFHAEKYGPEYSYDGFASSFNESARQWNPEEWADVFKEVGARYVVLVTKHHDGFLLWPSDHPNPKKKGWQTERDLVGELTSAVRQRGMKMGLYYSGSLDWSFDERPIRDTAGLMVNGPTTREYVDYVEAHFRELIDKYQPSVLWNDIGYPPGADLNELFAYYYNRISDGVVNDRWLQIPKRGRWLYSSWPIRPLLDYVMKRSLMKEGISPPIPPHSDYSTPEYTTLSTVSERKWECVRGIGKSFGYNSVETPKDYLTVPELVRMLVDIVSKNGNLLLNTGPTGDGRLHDVQLDRLSGMGRWLKTNGEAIFETRPWKVAEGETTEKIEVRFTEKNDDLYAILMDTPKHGEIRILGLQAASGTTVRLLGSRGHLAWEQCGSDLRIVFREELPESPAHALKISPRPQRV